MIVIFDKDIILNALMPAMFTVAGKNTMPSIEGVHLICTEDGSCTIETFDLEKGIRTGVKCTVIEEGNVILNANKFLQIIKVMPSGDIKVTVDDNFKATIESGPNSYFEIKALPGEDFPDLPEIIGERGFYISQAMFRKFVNRVAFSVAQNDSRPVFNGAYFEVSNTKLTIVACDSNRLAMCEKEIELENRNKDGSVLNHKFIVPGKTLNDLLKLAKDTDDMMEVRIMRRYLMFKIGEVSLYTKTIDAQYFDYTRLLPTSHSVRIKLNSGELLGALERSSLIVEDRLAGSIRSYVKFTVDDKLLVSTVSSNGNVFDEIAIEKDDPDSSIVIGFNCRFMLDALRVCDDCEMIMSFKNPLLGVLIEPQNTDDGKYTYFVMPIRMNN